MYPPIEKIRVNGILTEVQRWTSNSSRKTPIMFFFPGNPGACGFYAMYLDILHKRSLINICCVGHIGHSIYSTDTAIKGYSLTEQIDHKVAVIEYMLSDYDDVPPIILGGHSMGCYLVQETSKKLRYPISRGILLFPTIHHIAKSRNALQMWYLFEYCKNAGWLVGSMLSLIPEALKVALIKSSIGWSSPEHTVASTLSLIHGGVVYNTLTLAMHEMAEITELNEEFVTGSRVPLRFYFATKDDWVLDETPSLIRALLGEGAQNTLFISENDKHAFCMEAESSLRVADQTYKWISDLVHQPSM